MSPCKAGSLNCNAEMRANLSLTLTEVINRWEEERKKERGEEVREGGEEGREGKGKGGRRRDERRAGRGKVRGRRER